MTVRVQRGERYAVRVFGPGRYLTTPDRIGWELRRDDASRAFVASRTVSIWGSTPVVTLDADGVSAEIVRIESGVAIP